MSGPGGKRPQGERYAGGEETGYARWLPLPATGGKRSSSPPRPAVLPGRSDGGPANQRRADSRRADPPRTGADAGCCAEWSSSSSLRRRARHFELLVGAVRPVSRRGRRVGWRTVEPRRVTKAISPLAKRKCGVGSLGGTSRRGAHEQCLHEARSQALHSAPVTDRRWFCVHRPSRWAPTSSVGRRC